MLLVLATESKLLLVILIDRDRGKVLCQVNSCVFGTRGCINLFGLLKCNHNWNNGNFSHYLVKITTHCLSLQCISLLQRPKGELNRDVVVITTSVSVMSSIVAIISAAPQQCGIVLGLLFS